MKKKILLSVIGIIAVLSGVAAFSAFEAHVINVTAHIENALKVISPSELTFGTVFPQEYLEESIWITTSCSFLEDQTRVSTIDYKIVQKPKCINEAGEYAPVDYATHECPDNYTEMPSLCPYLSKTPRYNEDPEPYTDYGVPAFHDPDDPLSVATGTIDKDHDLLDEWVIDLDVPCFKGYCAQDWGHPGWELPYELESETFGCDLWVEVIGISMYTRNCVNDSGCKKDVACITPQEELGLCGIDKYGVCRCIVP